MLQPGRSATLGLAELAEHRQTEVRSLAARCLAYVNQYEPIVAALGDSSRKADWTGLVEQLEQGVARGPESAAAIRQAFQKRYVTSSPRPYTECFGATRNKTWTTAKMPNWSSTWSTNCCPSECWPSGTLRHNGGRLVLSTRADRGPAKGVGHEVAGQVGEGRNPCRPGGRGEAASWSGRREDREAGTHRAACPEGDRPGTGASAAASAGWRRAPPPKALPPDGAVPPPDKALSPEPL